MHACTPPPRRPCHTTSTEAHTTATRWHRLLSKPYTAFTDTPQPSSPATIRRAQRHMQREWRLYRSYKPRHRGSGGDRGPDISRRLAHGTTPASNRPVPHQTRADVLNSGCCVEEPTCGPPASRWHTCQRSCIHTSPLPTHPPPRHSPLLLSPPPPTPLKSICHGAHPRRVSGYHEDCSGCPAPGRSPTPYGESGRMLSTASTPVWSVDLTYCPLLSSFLHWRRLRTMCMTNSPMKRTSSVTPATM